MTRIAASLLVLASLSGCVDGDEPWVPLRFELVSWSFEDEYNNTIYFRATNVGTTNVTAPDVAMDISSYNHPMDGPSGATRRDRGQGGGVSSDPMRSIPLMLPDASVNLSYEATQILPRHPDVAYRIAIRIDLKYANGTESWRYETSFGCYLSDGSRAPIQKGTTYCDAGVSMLNVRQLTTGSAQR